MGLFGGSGDSSSGLDLSGDTPSSYGSKLRSSSAELDLSDFDGSSGSLSAGSGDLEMSLQREQQKALLMSAVRLSLLGITMVNLSAKLNFHFQIHKITDNCWDICVDSVGSSLGRRTETCLSNCSDRFVDTTLFVTNRFAQLASKMQTGRH
jgi:import inner membrane translocase subunit TIM8